MNIQTITLPSGVETEYAYAGEKNAPVLLFLHGLGANLRQFENQFAYFRNAYQVILMSLRGHGGSGLPEHQGETAFTLSAYAHDVIALMECLGVPQVHFTGNSMGGLVGYRIYEIAPEKLASLATFGTTAQLNSPAVLVAFVKTMTRLLGPSGLARVSLLSTKDKAVAEKIGEMFASAKAPALLHSQANIARYDFLDTLRRCDLPILLLRGAMDQDINKQLASTLAILKEKPDARIVEMDNAGHFLNMEKPEEFNRQYENFLNQAS
jgi:3-oxoadipate enol-lactonase